jgi:hypothetical protein
LPPFNKATSFQKFMPGNALSDLGLLLPITYISPRSLPQTLLRLI